jgi:5,10-methylene-tetrahydrofolate dehydrogenase/methenyl tetrahydrofolate cyclohydrolase/dephospho-CoA kinase
VLVGDDPASAIYVRGKLKSAGEAGLRADLKTLPASASLDDLLAVVEQLNHSEAHDGILVQSPLPAAMGAEAEYRVFDVIRPDKDVDGFHPVNVGLLVQNRARPLPRARPSGIIELLERSQVPIAGARAVVIGRSDIVGKPMALLLMHRHATVTICHSRTRDLPAVAADADILVAAIGRAGFVTPAFVKPGATVVDVGTTQVSDRAVEERLFGRIRSGATCSSGADRSSVGGRPSGRGGCRRRADDGARWRREPLTIRDAAQEYVCASAQGEGRLGRIGGIAGPNDRLPSRRPSRRSRRPAHVSSPDRRQRGPAKSNVLDQFRRRGVPCLDADELAHGVTAAGTEATRRSPRASARTCWAPTVRSIAASSGRLFSRIRQRAAISKRSCIRRSIARSRQACAASSWWGDGDFAVVDVPLLFETGAEGKFDRVIVTACSPETQLARLRERGLSEEAVRQRLAAQWPTEKKVPRQTTW